MTDIKLLPLPEGTEAGEYTMDAILFDHSDMTSYARANVSHATAAKDAEIERLRSEVEEARGLVTEANNSLYGSQSYFHSIDGGPYNRHHLANGIEDLKRRSREGYAAEARAERLAEALRLIAMPQRSDGTWNRDREACRQIAEEALRDHDPEVSNG